MQNRCFGILTLIWFALLLPDLSARYSFGWDSSQFDRGAVHFDIARHQPHPPGYPLWCLSIRALAPIVGNPNRAQVVLAMLFTIAALGFFRALTRDLLGERIALAATALLAFSPFVLLYANSSQIYAVDLFASCFGGWLAAALRSGRTRFLIPGFAVLALTAGFRPSGVTFLLPFLCFALWPAALNQPLRAMAGIAAGAAVWLAWLVPTALSAGGFVAYHALTDAEVAGSVQKTSIFYGAPPVVHFKMVIAVCVYFAIALAGFAIPLAVALWRRRATFAGSLSPSCTPLFFLLWLAPNLAFLFLLHGFGSRGYSMLSLPPLAILFAWFARHALSDTAVPLAGIGVFLLVSFFPFERYIHSEDIAMLFLRSTPRITRLIEAEQRELRSLIDSMPGRADQKLMFCLCPQFEAPNMRTVTFDFADVAWIEGYSPDTSIPAGVRSLGWVCKGRTLPSAIRERFPQVHPFGGNELYSLWTVVR
jgi:hypothetical protein